MIRPRRSVLYMPGSNARAIDKARGLPVDGVIIDLEDAVAPDAKETGAHAGGRCRQGRRLWFARGLHPHQRHRHANGASTISTPPYKAAPDAILIPKVGSAADARR